MMTRSGKLVGGVCGALLVAGCGGLDILGPGDPSAGTGDLVSNGVRVTLTVSPDEVTPPGVILAALRYENTTRSTVAIGSAYGCLAFAGVYLGNQRISFPSTDYACTAAFRSFEVPPGESIGMDWPLHIGGEGVTLTPGEYRFVAQLNTHGTELERTFVVR